VRCWWDPVIYFWSCYSSLVKSEKNSIFVDCESPDSGVVNTLNLVPLFNWYVAYCKDTKTWWIQGVSVIVAVMDHHNYCSIRGCDRIVYSVFAVVPMTMHIYSTWYIFTYVIATGAWNPRSVFLSRDSGLRNLNPASQEDHRLLRYINVCKRKWPYSNAVPSPGKLPGGS